MTRHPEAGAAKELGKAGAEGKRLATVAREGGVVHFCRGARNPKPCCRIAVRDIGKYGLMAFERHAELNGRAIDIAGDQLTMPATAEILTQAVGHKVSFYPVPIEEVRKMSADFATMLEWFDRVGYDVDIERTAKENGIRPTSLATWAATADWAPTPAIR